MGQWALEVGQRSIPCILTVFLEPIPCDGKPCSALMCVGGAWSFLNLTLLTFYGRPYPLCGVYGVGVRGDGVIKLIEGKRELRLIYKMNKNIKQKHMAMKTPGNTLG